MISESLKDCLSRFFSSYAFRRFYNLNKVSSSYDSNNIYSRFIEVMVPYRGNSFIPVINYEEAIPTIGNWICTNEMCNNKSLRIVYSLQVGDATRGSTADSIIKAVGKCPPLCKLLKVTTNKGLTYYGGNGVIFDGRWNPLILCGFIIHIDGVNSRYKIIKPICYVSPSVFSNTDIVSKAIVKKVIPYFSTHMVQIPANLSGSIEHTNDGKFDVMDVVVTDLGKFIKTPQEPAPIYNMDDALWKFLEENKSKLL